jgi:hypothetical protein
MTDEIEEAAKAGIEQIKEAARNDNLEALIEEYPECEETIRMFAGDSL